jgi:hypothetical protein
MATLILGAFQDQSDANKVIIELERLGASSDDFSLIMPDKSDHTDNFRETLTESGTARVATEVAAGGAAIGGLVGALIGLGVPEDAARRHQAVIKKGGAILGVQDNAISKSQARDVLEENGAEEVVDIAHSPLPARLAAN